MDRSCGLQVAIALLAALPVLAQTPAAAPKPVPPTLPEGEAAVLAGTIVNAATGAPLPGARVVLRRSGEQQGRLVDRAELWEYTATANEKGEFSIPNMVPSDYGLTPSTAGFEMSRGRHRSLAVAAGKNAPLTIRLFPVSKIEGVVVDANRNPLPKITVELIGEAWNAGQRSLTAAAFPPVTTGEDGRFVIANALPGTYYLYASPGAGAPTRERLPRDSPPAYPYGNAWFPNVAEPDAAAPITVSPGVDTTGLRIELKPALYFTVRGRVNGLAADAKNVRMRLTARSGRASNMILDSGISVFNRVMAPVQEDGSFELPNVAPGAYKAELINAHGVAMLEVGDSDFDDLRVQAWPVFTIAGKAVYEDGTPFQGMQLEIDTYDPVRGLEYQFARVNADGTFRATNVAAGQQRLAVNIVGPTTTMVRRVEIGGRTFEGGAFEYGGPDTDRALVTISRTGAEIAGLVEGDLPQRGVVALEPSPLLPTDVRRTQTALLNGSSSFRFTLVEGGRYRLCAWTDEMTYSKVAGNPRFAARLSGDCEEVTVKHGGAEQVKLQWLDPADYK